MDQSIHLSTLKAKPNNWNSQETKVQHQVTYFENCLSRFIWITSATLPPTLGQENCVNQNNIQKLQNRTLRKITFEKPHDPVNPLYKDLKILKFEDFLHLQNCLFVTKIEQNQRRAKYFVSLKHCGDNHNYQTRAFTKRILDTPLYKSNTYGSYSAEHYCIVDWNQF